MTTLKVDPLFATPVLNDLGAAKALEVSEVFTIALLRLEGITPLGGREGAIVRSRLQEACDFAHRAVAAVESNQALPE